jgi:PEP-CTERM motif-containing protein
VLNGRRAFISLKFFGTALMLVSAWLVPERASGAPIVLNDPLGGYYATAEFTVVSGNLVLTLTNTAPGDVWDPAHVLTGLFFDIAGDPTLTALSATTCSTCVTNHTNPDPTDVGGEWAFRHATDLAFGANYGISSTGLGLFGPADVVGSPNLAGPGSPGGVEYGITSANDNPSTNGGLSGVPLISNYVIFTFAGLPGNFDVNTISNITWQYGTSLSEAVPEPATLALFGPAALAAFVARRRRARRKQQ